MKTPQPIGRAVDAVRMSAWLDDFSGYRVNVSDVRINNWMQQFDEEDRDLAARILDVVDFITEQQITSAFRSILESLPGWDLDQTKRSGKWRFVAFSGSAGESGDSMIYRFRHANNLTGIKYKELFIHISDLARAELGPDDNVVFIDDFAATGTQACDAWENGIEELLYDEPNVFLVLIVSSIEARERIAEETRLVLITNNELSQLDNIFSDACVRFSINEKDTILNYCERADRNNPRGFGECGYVTVFPHACPNNTIPILHARNGRWEGLFRRYD